MLLDAVLLFAGTTVAALLRWGAPAGNVKVGGLDYYGDRRPGRRRLVGLAREHALL